MRSVWKSRDVCRAIPITLFVVAYSLTGAGPSGAGTRAWAPLADLYAARSVATDSSTQGAVPSPTLEPVAMPSPTLEPVAAPDAGPGEAARSINPRRALLFSLLLPGAGEMYMGHRGRATGFFVTEGAIWAHFAAWEIAGHLRKDDYIEQARINAGIGVDSEADDYWRLVGTYDRSSGTGPDAYEEALRRDARLEFPTDPAAQDAWVAERLPTGSRAWDWSNSALQGSYVDTRQNATRAFNRAKFSFALAILNRIASAIDTQILNRSDSRSRQSSLDSDEPRLLATVTADGGGRLLVRHRF